MASGSRTAKQPKLIPVSDIALDDENPRLPEPLVGADEPELLQYFAAHGVLKELAASFAQHGFFQHEPIIALDLGGGRYKALEGNRRLATLKILLGLSEDHDPTSLTRAEVTPDLEALSRVPCFVVEDASDVEDFIAYRHIGGLKPWSPPSKARWIYREATRLDRAGDGTPFKTIASAIGSTTPAVRALFVAYAIAESARFDHGIDVENLLDERQRRFGVWQRVLYAAEVKRHFGFNVEAKAVAAIRDSASSMNSSRLAEVVDDIAPAGEAKPVLTDSREATTYARVLANPKAREILRRERNFDIAKELVSDDLFLDRLDRLVKRCSVLNEEALGLSTCPEGALSAAQRLTRTARAIENALQELP